MQPDWGPPPDDWVDDEVVSRVVSPRPGATVDRPLTRAEARAVVREIDRRGGGVNQITESLDISGQKAAEMLRLHRARKSVDMADDQTPCSYDGCRREARMAVRTTRPTRGKIETRVYWDNRTAPKVAEQLCKEHGLLTLAEVGRVLVAPDEAVAIPVTAVPNGAVTIPVTDLSRPA